MCLHWEDATASVTTLESNSEEEIHCVQGDGGGGEGRLEGLI